jgi:orotate phosphoribosyltransferase-like protein
MSSFESVFQNVIQFFGSIRLDSSHEESGDLAGSIRTDLVAVDGKRVVILDNDIYHPSATCEVRREQQQSDADQKEQILDRMQSV